MNHAVRISDGASIRHVLLRMLMSGIPFLFFGYQTMELQKFVRRLVLQSISLVINLMTQILF